MDKVCLGRRNISSLDESHLRVVRARFDDGFGHRSQVRTHGARAETVHTAHEDAGVVAAAHTGTGLVAGMGGNVAGVKDFFENVDAFHDWFLPRGPGSERGIEAVDDHWGGLVCLLWGGITVRYMALHYRLLWPGVLEMYGCCGERERRERGNLTEAGLESDGTMEGWASFMAWMNCSWLMPGFMTFIWARAS